MDDRLVESFGQTIREWVERFGWDAFREEEAGLLTRLGGAEGVVVATGGGVVALPLNRQELRRQFFVVWLRARLSTIVMRLTQDPRTAGYRPPLTGLSQEVEVKTILAERTPLYDEVADLVVDTDDLLPRDIVSRILERMEGPPEGQRPASLTP